VRDEVAAQLDAIGVHDVDAHRVVEVLIVFDDVVLRVHEVQRVAAAAADVL
jgi:hypothetical protein